MPNAFIFSAANAAAQQHFQDTVVNGLPLEVVLPYIQSPAKAAILRRAYPNGVSYLWAGHSGGQDELYWQMMQRGDLVLGYRNRSVISAAYFVEKVRRAELGLRAWPDAVADPYDLIYFLSPPQFIARPIGDLPQYFGEMYQGLRRLASSDLILQHYGAFEHFVQQALGGAAQAPPNLAVSDVEVAAAAGFEDDPKVRRAVERRAVDLAVQTYIQMGYRVVDTGEDNPYDLSCYAGGVEVVRVEVKGSRGAAATVKLTGGEVRHVQQSPCRVDLFVVGNIHVVAQNGGLVGQGGAVVSHRQGWIPLEADLTETEYRYRVTMGVLAANPAN